MLGKVRNFNNAKGYGFIFVPDLKINIFCHYTSILDEGYKSLVEGEEVEIESVEESAKGKFAIGVKKINA